MTCLSVLALTALFAWVTAWTPQLFPKPLQTITGVAATMGRVFEDVSVNAPDSETTSLIQEYIKNVKPYVYVNDAIPSGQVNSLTVNINEAVGNTIPNESSEHYDLSVSTSSVTIQANTVWGAMRAIETLTQLVNYDESSSSYQIFTYRVIDEPRYKWRGLHMDTARHWHPLRSIKRQIRAMAAAKFNVLHWHLVDAESFPWTPESVPEMSQGAWAPAYKYSNDDIREIVNYARGWGIFTYVELDTPGHTYAWGAGRPNIRASCPSYEHNINNVALDVSEEETYDVVNKLFNEILSLTGGKYVHTGGDEIVSGCWKEDPQVAAFMSKNGWNTVGVWNYYISRLMGYMPQGARPIFWQDTFDNGCTIPSNAILQAWRDQDSLGEIVKAGYNGILSGGWYLDQQIPGPTTHYAFYSTWEDFYDNEPTSGLSLSNEEANRILGGEACMWGEGIDESSIDTFIWPRALAVSERLWSPKTITSHDDAKTRMQQHRCQLVRRGVSAGPIGPNAPCPGEYTSWTTPMN